MVVATPTNVVDLAVQAGLAKSRGNAKYFVREGALRFNDVKVVDAERVVDPSELPGLLSVGNRKVRLVAG